MESARDKLLRAAQHELLEMYLEKHYGWDCHFGRPDKPFHKNECLCDRCLEWVMQHPVR